MGIYLKILNTSTLSIKLHSSAKHLAYSDVFMDCDEAYKFIFVFVTTQKMKVNVEKILRSIPSDEKVFRSTKRVSVIKAVDCVIALSKQGLDSQTIKNEIQKLLETYKLVKVKINEKAPESVELSISKNVNASDYYMWAEESRDYLTIILGLLVVTLVLGLFMYRIWPPWLKLLGKYVEYLIIAFFVFILLLAAIRLIVFGITYVFKYPGLWIFPNLFSDCGFFESFVPAYSWANVQSEEKEE